MVKSFYSFPPKVGEAFLLSPLAIAVNQITPDVGVKITSIYHLTVSLGTV